MHFKANSGDYEQPPVGTHVARCVKVIDLGTQEQTFEGKTSYKRQVLIGWELPNELMERGDFAGQPFTVTKFYTQSLHEKAKLRSDLSNWRGRQFTEQELAGFDARNIVGKPCMVSLTENDKGRVSVTAVTALPKGTNPPGQVNPSVFLSLEKAEFDAQAFAKLSDKMQDMIKKSPEYAELQAKSSGGAEDMEDSPLDEDADIPF